MENRNCPEPAPACAGTVPDCPGPVYPGTPLRWGCSGAAVTGMQTCLNRIAVVYTAINTQTADGKFGQNMYNAVIRFQRQNSLSADGVIGPMTWNRIIDVDLSLLGRRYTDVTTPYPGYIIAKGDSGDNVRFIQSYLGALPGLFPVKVDGIFGSSTLALVKAFQTQQGLKADGLVGPATWQRMIYAFNAMHHPYGG